jgi:endonuclease G
MATDLDADPELDRTLIERAKQAAARWQSRQKVRDARTKALKENRPLDADSPARLAMRINRLVTNVRLSARYRRPPDNPTLRRLVERATPIDAEDMSPDLIQEVVLGARNFLSIEFLERGIQSAKRVGRVLIRSGGDIRPRGTGFLVAPGLVLTNEHVLRSAEQAAACMIEMDYEQNRFGPAVQSQIFRFEPQRFFANNPDLDFALVAVAKQSEHGASLAQYGWLTLVTTQGKIAVNENDFLNVIQHPLGREKEVVVRDNRLLDLAVADNEEGQLGPFLHYEADTEKGSSGSPVLNDQWEVVALHHSGVPKTDDNGRWLDKDGKVWDQGRQSVSEISWIANEGARVSSLTAAFAKLAVKDHEKPLLDLLLSAPPSEPGSSVGREEAMTPAPRMPDRDSTSVDRRHVEAAAVPLSPAKGDNMDFEVALRISISLGEAKALGTSRPADVTAQRAAEDLLLERLGAEDYADRNGYDRRFLGGAVSVPFPKMKNGPRFGNALRVPRPARPNDRFELRYHRFSVLMNEGRRIAYVSACNVNFNPPETASRDEGSQSWRLDPRLNNDQQLGAAYYDNNEYDKGHLTRRDDVAWGRDKDDALASNWDSFHYTNAGPQHSLFNRSDDFTDAGLDLWGDLENHISEQGEAQRSRLCIFNGPIFGDHDKPLSNAFVPLAYYKIVIWRDRGQPPGALGFVLEQEDLIRDLPEEAIDAGRFSVRQKRISWIESRLDVSFGDVTGWDQMPRPDEALEALDDDGILLRSASDISFAGTTRRRR